MEHTTIKALHIFGVILFLGNIIVTAFWKTFADRTRDLGIIRYATRMVNLTDIVFTAGGVAILMVTGHMMAPAFGGVMQAEWIRWSYLLVVGTGVIWLVVLIPTQIAQSHLLKGLSAHDAIPEKYWKLAKLWAVAGAVATLLPLPAVYLMAVKPV